MGMYRQTWLRTITALILVAWGIYVSLTAGFGGQEVLQEILILVLIAIALDVVAGFGGMVSLCHGALAGVGAYAFAGLALKAGVSPPLALAGAVVIAGIAATLVGAITARAHGIFLIMATLAFGQMAYSYVFKSPDFGGSDGMAGVPLIEGIDPFFDPTAFSLVLLGMCVSVYILSAWLLSTGFGRTLVGIHSNEGRMRALGLPTWQYKAAAFGYSGLICGLAGAMAAQRTGLVSPEMMSWTLSGEVLILVILGGMGTLIGPVIGVIAVELVHHAIAGAEQTLGVYRNYWHLVIGVLLVIAVFAGGRGIYGGFERLLAHLQRRLWPPRKAPTLTTTPAAAPAPREAAADA